MRLEKKLSENQALCFQSQTTVSKLRIVFRI